MNKKYRYLRLLIAELPLMLLIIGTVLISVGLFMISKVVGLIATGVLISIYALIFAYTKGSVE